MSGRNSLLGWWYICIGLAFVALAVRSYVAGATGWGVWLRLIVAVGIVLLGNVEFGAAEVHGGGNFATVTRHRRISNQADFKHRSRCGSCASPEWISKPVNAIPHQLQKQGPGRLVL
jgi:hypothetical protein